MIVSGNRVKYPSPSPGSSASRSLPKETTTNSRFGFSFWQDQPVCHRFSQWLGGGPTVSTNKVAYLHKKSGNKIQFPSLEERPSIRCRRRRHSPRWQCCVKVIEVIYLCQYIFQSRLGFCWLSLFSCVYGCVSGGLWLADCVEIRYQLMGPRRRCTMELFGQSCWSKAFQDICRILYVQRKCNYANANALCSDNSGNVLNYVWTHDTGDIHI